jgi:hypothetical protein
MPKIPRRIEPAFGVTVFIGVFSATAVVPTMGREEPRAPYAGPAAGVIIGLAAVVVVIVTTLRLPRGRTRRRETTRSRAKTEWKSPSG